MGKAEARSRVRGGRPSGGGGGGGGGGSGNPGYEFLAPPLSSLIYGLDLD